MRTGDGSVDDAASFAHGLVITGNVFDANTPNSAYSTAPDVGSQWINETGFTRATQLTIGGVAARDVTFLNGGFLITTVPPAPRW